MLLIAKLIEAYNNAEFESNCYTTKKKSVQMNHIKQKKRHHKQHREKLKTFTY